MKEWTDKEMEKKSKVEINKLGDRDEDKWRVERKIWR